MTELPDFMRKYGKTEKNRKSEGISFPVFKRLQVQSGCKKDHNDNRLCRELGEDGYFYQYSRLIICAYDKRRKIQDVGNFIKALERTGETAGKDIKVYVGQSPSPV